MQPPHECSLSVITHAQPGKADVEGAQLSQSHTFTLAVSLGLGDLQLVKVESNAVVSVTQPVFPIRPEPPLSGVFPFKIEAAYATLQQPDQLRCVLSTLHDKTDTQAAVSRMYSVTLAFGPSPAARSGAASSVAVADVQLLARAALPPHIALPSPSHDSVLLGLEPNSLEVGAAAASTPAAAAAVAATTAADVASGTGAGSHPGLGSAGAPVPAAAQDGSGAGAGAGAGPMDEDVVDIECRRPGPWLLRGPCMGRSGHRLPKCELPEQLLWQCHEHDGSCSLAACF